MRKVQILIVKGIPQGVFFTDDDIATASSSVPEEKKKDIQVTTVGLYLTGEKYKYKYQDK
jgi:hypothetical protein